MTLDPLKSRLLKGETSSFDELNDNEFNIFEETLLNGTEDEEDAVIEIDDIYIDDDKEESDISDFSDEEDDDVDYSDEDEDEDDL